MFQRDKKAFSRKGANNYAEACKKKCRSFFWNWRRIEIPYIEGTYMSTHIWHLHTYGIWTYLASIYGIHIWHLHTYGICTHMAYPYGICTHMASAHIWHLHTNGMSKKRLRPKKGSGPKRALAQKHRAKKILS